MRPQAQGMAPWTGAPARPPCLIEPGVFRPAIADGQKTPLATRELRESPASAALTAGSPSRQAAPA